MKLRSVKQVKTVDLEHLSTERLLSYLQKLQRCEDSLESSDWSQEEILKTDGVVFKSSSEWKKQYKQVKTILDKRSNVDKC